MGKQRKTCENGKTQENKLRKTEKSIGKQGKTQENKETRENRKKQGVRVENARKQWKKGEMWKKTERNVKNKG